MKKHHFLMFGVFALVAIVILVVVAKNMWVVVRYNPQDEYPVGFMSSYLEKNPNLSCDQLLFKVYLESEANTLYESMGRYGLRIVAFASVSSPDYTVQITDVKIRSLDGVQIGGGENVPYIINVNSIDGSQDSPGIWYYKYGEHFPEYLYDIRRSNHQALSVVMDVVVDNGAGKQHKQMEFLFERYVRRGVLKFST